MPTPKNTSMCIKNLDMILLLKNHARRTDSDSAIKFKNSILTFKTGQPYG